MTAKANLQILALDDEPFMLKMLGLMLNGLGYSQITYHESGADALAAYDVASHDRPDIILLDINMPGIDGVEFVRHLAERQYPGSLILVSGEDELMLRATEKLARAYHLTVLGALRKPPTPAGLAALLEQACLANDKGTDNQARSAGKAYSVERLREAIYNGELINYYQPKVAVATGEVIAVETLVRWQHPEDGLVFPDRFVALAEAHGLIGDLTRAVLRQALEQARDWSQAGMTLRIAVNVSMDNLTDVEFADFVAAATTAAGVPAHLLVLEVTESRLMQKLTTALDVLTRLRLKRFRLSIDDFGTGHSSLVQLRDLPFDELKIDQGFTRNAWCDSRLKAIFEASLELANQLGMEVVAEGVEDANDWAFLRASGCPIAQGYFIGRPMPAAALPAWMRTWHTRLQQEHLLQ